MRKRDIGKKFHQDNRGGAMAMVLIIIAFISILASVLMFVAYSGYQMRLVDRQGKDNFYTAETVLDEINTGLQEEISVALSKAYQRVMVNYALFETAEKRNEEFYNVYYDELQKALQLDPAHTNQYSVAKLRGYLSPEVLGDGKAGVTPDGSKLNFGTYGAIVESAVTPESFTLALKKDGILLKDLKVSYVNRRGYISIITTDIRIALPSVNFSQTSAFPGISGYCLIADETLTMGNTLPGGSLTVKGDTYAGRMELGKKTGTSYLASKICFTRPDGAEEDSTAKVVSRENITLNESSLTTEKVELWGENLLVNSSSGLTGSSGEKSKVALDGSTNLKDDLVLNGAGSEVAIKGEYTGFGNTADTAAISSAIIVNGKDSLLDLSGITSMNISGRAYVSTSYKTGDPIEIQGKPVDETANTSDVAMGQSVAVKSDQLIYLVPPQALGCRKDENGIIGESAFGSNPLKLEQYEEIINNPDKYVLLDGTKQIASLGYRSLNNYIEQEDVAGGTKAYVPEVIFKQTNAGPLVYCYLRFKSEEAANQYFADYYNVNATQVDAFTKLYAKEIKMADTSSLLYLNLAGNMLSYTGSEAGKVVDATDSHAAQKRADVIAITKSDIFKALSAKMVTNIAQLSQEEQGRTAFPNIINKTKMTEIINVFDTVGSGIVQIDTDTPGSVKSTILAKYGYTVDNSTPDSVHMIISLDTVTVEKDFTGLIISAKDIVVEDSEDNDHDVVLDTISLDDFSEMLLAKKTDGADEYYILDVFRDGVNYAYSGSTSEDKGTEEVSMADLIIYERWSKR